MLHWMIFLCVLVIDGVAILFYSVLLHSIPWFSISKFIYHVNITYHLPFTVWIMDCLPCAQNGAPKFWNPTIYQRPPIMDYSGYHMGASINRGPQNRPKYIMVLIIGTTKMGPLIFGSKSRSGPWPAAQGGVSVTRPPSGSWSPRPALRPTRTS